VATVWKVIGTKVTEEEFQKTVLPITHDCYHLGLIDHDTVSSFVKFCINFWIAHYTTKKLEFETQQQHIDQEREKLAAIVDQKGQAIAYAKMPIEIGVYYRLANDEEVLLDAFLLRRQQYVLYGSPESRVVCRYIDTPVSTDKHEIKAMKYEEGVVRIQKRDRQRRQGEQGHSPDEGRDT
jgi:Protein of unknown function (DUF432)